MNTIAARSPSGFDAEARTRTDVRGDRLFEAAVTAAGVFVLLSLFAAAAWKLAESGCTQLPAAFCICTNDMPFCEA